MRCQLAVIADAANLSQEGKLNILGEFDTIFAAKVPTVWPSLVFVAKVEVGEEDGSHFEFELRVVTEDGDLIFRATITGDIKRPGQPTGDRPRIPVLLPLRNAMFPKHSTYTFELYGNGVLLHDLPLHVRPRPTRPQPGR